MTETLEIVLKVSFLCRLRSSFIYHEISFTQSGSRSFKLLGKETFSLGFITETNFFSKLFSYTIYTLWFKNAETHNYQTHLITIHNTIACIVNTILVYSTLKFSHRRTHEWVGGWKVGGYVSSKKWRKWRCNMTCTKWIFLNRVFENFETDPAWPYVQNFSPISDLNF